MSGTVSLKKGGAVAHVRLSHPGKLNAMLDCDERIVARLEGNCMGAGIEIASCCNIRLAGASACFDAPIAKLGFPMAPRRFLNSVVADGAMGVAEHLCVNGICELAVTSARLNKQYFRAVAPVLRAHSAIDLIANAYRYAGTAEHREGVTASIEKRQPRFAG